MSPDEMKAFVTGHFEQLINQGDLSVISRNVREDYVDHDGREGRKANLKEARDRTTASLARMKDLRVEIRDILADGDKVVVRNVWTAYDEGRSERVEMHGFVLFRIQDGKLAERWATVTEPAQLTSDTLDW